MSNTSGWEACNRTIDQSMALFVSLLDVVWHAFIEPQKVSPARVRTTVFFLQGTEIDLYVWMCLCVCLLVWTISFGFRTLRWQGRSPILNNTDGIGDSNCTGDCVDKFTGMTIPNEQSVRELCRVLEVQADVTVQDLKKAYYRLAKKIHPDKNPDDALATSHFVVVSSAYQTLRDELRASRSNPNGTGVNGGK